MATYVLSGSESLDPAGTIAAYIYQYRITAAFLPAADYFTQKCLAFPGTKYSYIETHPLKRLLTCSGALYKPVSPKRALNMDSIGESLSTVAEEWLTQFEIALAQ